MNYDFKTKNDWRGFQWNRIIDRLPVKPKDAVVLYLAGTGDLDREAAKKRGFRDDNLIAVDRESSVVNAIRAKGSLAIRDDIFKIICNWTKVPINVLLLDLMCGWTDRFYVQLFRKLFFSNLFFDTIISVNLQRGRDSSASSLFFDKKIRGTNRAKSFFDIYLESALRVFLDGPVAIMPEVSVPIPREGSTSRERKSEILIELIKCYPEIFDPKECFYSYPSDRGNLMFDSVLFRNISPDQMMKTMGEWLGRTSAGSFDQDLTFGKKSKVFRKIAAVKAIRTRRILEHSQ